MGTDNVLRVTYGNLHRHTDFADLRLSAAEEMEGELPAGIEPHNYHDTAGPAYSQLFLDEQDDDRVEG